MEARGVRWSGYRKLTAVFCLALGALVAACGTLPQSPLSRFYPVTPSRQAASTPQAGQPAMASPHVTVTPAPTRQHTPTPFMPLRVVTRTPPPETPAAAMEASDELTRTQALSATATLTTALLVASLPDLQTLPPSDLRLVYDPQSGRTFVRFSNEIWNAGPGVLELAGETSDDGDRIQVTQLIYAADGSLVDDQLVGEFLFHPSHNHWHLQDFAVYEIWSVDEEGALEALVASGGKISYCVTDIALAEMVTPDPNISQHRLYTTCLGSLQGLSPGWIDVYEHHLPGQWVEVTGLDEGVYALVSTVNPEGQVREADDGNNTGITYFELQGMRLRVLEGPPGG